MTDGKHTDIGAQHDEEIFEALSFNKVGWSLYHFFSLARGFNIGNCVCVLVVVKYARVHIKIITLIS